MLDGVKWGHKLTHERKLFLKKRVKKREREHDTADEGQIDFSKEAEQTGMKREE